MTRRSFSQISITTGLVALLATTSTAAVLAAPRKHRQTVAPATRDTDTSSTAAIPSKAPQQPSVPDPTARDDDALPPPFHLPTASRQRMRDCGLQWQAMKTSGEAGEQIWRDFASQCLAAANGPFDKRSER